jgi:hypothetical protein
MRKFIQPLLIILILLDVIYVAIIFPYPELWYKYIHAAPYVDPAGLLHRTGAVWASFALFQIIALIKWRKHPHWLMLVAGIRFTEIFADWTYVYFAQSLTWYGKAGLLSAPLINFGSGLFFFKAYFNVKKDS